MNAKARICMELLRLLLRRQAENSASHALPWKPAYMSICDERYWSHDPDTGTSVVLAYDAVYSCFHFVTMAMSKGEPQRMFAEICADYFEREASFSMDALCARVLEPIAMALLPSFPSSPLEFWA